MIDASYKQVDFAPVGPAIRPPCPGDLPHLSMPRRRLLRPPAAPACSRLMPGTLFGCSNLRHGAAVPRLRREAGALDPSQTRPAQIFIDDDHLFFSPAQLADFIIQIILASGGLAVVLDLCGLAVCGALGFEERIVEFGMIRHRAVAL